MEIHPMFMREKAIFLRCQYCPKQPTESMQSLSKSPRHVFAEIERKTHPKIHYEISHYEISIHYEISNSQDNLEKKSQRTHTTLLLNILKSYSRSSMVSQQVKDQALSLL